MLFILILPLSLTWSQQDITGISKKVLLLPFRPVHSRDKSEMSDSVSTLLFSSLYSFLSIIPFADLPDREFLEAHSNVTDIPHLAQKEKADFVVYGEFDLTGDGNEPEIVMHIKVWSLSARSVILDQAHKSKVDLDIFDTIDRFTEDSLVKAFEIKSGISRIFFSQWQTGNAAYEIYINNRLEYTVTNQEFSWSRKVLGDTSYKIAIKQKGGDLVYKKWIKVTGGTSTNISYQALGKVEFTLPNNVRIFVPYQFFMDDRQVMPKAIYQDVPAERIHILDTRTNGISVTNYQFFLKDQEFLRVTPSGGYIAKWYFSLNVGLKGGSFDLGIASSNLNSTLNSGLGLGLAARYYLGPRLILDGEINFQRYATSSKEFSITALSIPLGISFSIINNWKSPRRLSLGVFTETQILQSTFRFFTDGRDYTFWNAAINAGVLLDWHTWNNLCFDLRIYFPIDHTYTSTAAGNNVQLKSLAKASLDVGYRVPF